MQHSPQGANALGTVFSEYSGSAIDDSGIDYLGCMYKMFGLQLPFIKVPPSTSIAFHAGRQYRTFVLYNGNFISITFYNSYPGERIITTTSATRAVSFSLYNLSDLKNVYVKNANTGEVYFNGAEYTDQ